MIKLIGFGLKKIKAEKTKEIVGELKINSNIKIEEIEKKEIEIIKEGNVFNFKFDFEINYDPEYGKIKFEGDLLILIKDNNISEKIKKDWEEKKISEEIKINLMNLIFSKCYLKALQLEEDLNLPYHIPLPKFSKEKKE